VTTPLWTPRAPAEDEPACWSWPVPPLATRDEWLAEEMASGLSLGAIEMMERGGGGPASSQYTDFHADRCAICGCTGYLVEDHCHETGQIRGSLCRSDNVREGRSDDPVYIRYRRLHPASILGYYVAYTGRSWAGGWCWYTHPAEAAEAERTLVDRQASPWPPWSPDDPLDAAPPAGHEPPQRDPEDRWGDNNPGVAIRKAVTARRAREAAEALGEPVASVWQTSRPPARGED
jgi:hypothetical protein